LNIRKILYKTILWTFLSVAVLLLLAVGSVYVFKDKIIGASVVEINKYLNTKVDINPKIDLSLFEKFPQVAIGFKDVKVYESTPGSKNLLGKADHLFLTFDFWNILDGKYIINKLYLENGEFNLRVYKDGENNYTILKKDSTQNGKGNGGLDLTDIFIKNVLVKYRNESNGQYYEVLSHELKAEFAMRDDRYLIKLTGPQLINTIQVHDGEYFKGKEILISSNLEYDDHERKLTILPTVVSVEQSEFKVEGMYAYKNVNLIDIKIDNSKGDIHTLLSLIPKKYYEKFSSYRSDGDIYFNAFIKGKISETENAAIEVKFGCKKASFYHPDLHKKIMDANFSGIFSNGEKRNNSTTTLKLENIRFDFDERMIQGNFLYRNPDKPYVAFDLTGAVNAASVLGFYKLSGIKAASGMIDFDIQFKGVLDDLKTREGHNRIETAGEISIKDLTCVPEEGSYKLEKTNGTFLFNKNDIAITDFTTRVGKSDFSINGMLKNLIGAMLLENGRMLADIQVQCGKVDVEELLSFRAANDEVENDEIDNKPKGKFPFLEKYVIAVDVDIKEIVYKKVTMNRFRGSLSFDQPLMKAENISFQIANGELKLTSLLNFESEQKIETTIRAGLSGIKIDSLFCMFDNFGQEFITYKNLKGEFIGNVEMAFNWNQLGEIDTRSLVANIDGSIMKGELNEFEPMKNLSRFIQAKELEHIVFSELKNKVYIENRKISFPEMQILSNVSDISFSGTHTFDNEMDYKLSIPLKNLKKPKVDKDAAFGAIEEDNKRGSTLFLTIKGTANDYKIGYDTKRTKAKIQEDLKKEKQEFKNIFKKKEEDVQQTVKPNQEDFFDFE
jgi:hypothetical protein